MKQRSKFGNPKRALRALALLCAASACALSCDFAPRVIQLPKLPERADAGQVNFVCKTEDSYGCHGNNIHYRCKRSGEFIEATEVDCAAKGQVCDAERECVTCMAGDKRCRPCQAGDPDCNSNLIEVCGADGQGFSVVRECGSEDMPEVCYIGECMDACRLAQSLNSYAGCEFFGADLDNAALDDMDNAAAQQYAIVVANPQRVPVTVRVSLNDGKWGEPTRARELDKKLVAPGDLEVFKLPQREVDGSSLHGINDGTHSALSSNAYRVTSNYPISAYQFNPLENVHVFSNDASLLLPVPALGKDYTVVGWPQTIGNSNNPDQDFDHTSSNEDLRAFLTIIGTQDATDLRVELGSKVLQVVPNPPNLNVSRAGDVLNLKIGPYDIVNLETQGLNADFTGTLVHASNPVAIFVGSEASDVPTFGTYATRQCCADHLEEQLLPDQNAGTSFVVGRMPPRAKALNQAALEGESLCVAEMNEPEWIRVVAVRQGKQTHVRTTLDPPDDQFTLQEHGDAILRADRDFVIESDEPIHVLEALGSQGVTGIPKQYPGGDPSIIVVPPVLQFRKDYIFLTPDKYAFDFVTMVAPPDAHIELDGAPLPDTCETTKPADVLQSPKDASIEWVVHRCQLSFPKVDNHSSMGCSAPNRVDITDGEQHDGTHTLVSDKPISIIVYGFDRFVSYAYVGGLNLDQLN
jgi:hypothetical protein